MISKHYLFSAGDRKRCGGFVRLIWCLRTLLLVLLGVALWTGVPDTIAGVWRGGDFSWLRRAGFAEEGDSGESCVSCGVNSAALYFACGYLPGNPLWLEGAAYKRVQASCALIENEGIVGRNVGSFGLPWARRDLDDPSVMGKCDDAGGLCDKTRTCCGGDFGEGWTESCFVARAEECELHGGLFGQAKQGRAAGGRPVCWDILSGKSAYNTSRPRKVCRVRY